MFSTKKTIWTIIIAILFFSAVGRTAIAQCDTFDFPLIQDDSILFFNCDSGELQKFDTQTTPDSIPKEKSLGGFVHSLTWSPDGTRVIILAENASAAKQTLKFYSPERELNSLNWWVYDFKNDQTTLLDKEILSIGWVSNNEVVYNWNNLELSTAKISNLKIANHTKIASIANDTNNLNRIIPPINANKTIIFPMEKGFYTIALNEGEAKTKYYSLTGKIKKVLLEPYTHELFIIQSENSLYGLPVLEQVLDTITNDFSALDLAFSDQNSLVFLDNDKKPFSFDLNSKVKAPILTEPADDISRVFSTKNRGEFLFVTENSVYRKNMADNSLALIGQIPKEIAQPDTSIPGRRFNFYLIIIPFLVLLALTLGTFIYKRYIRQ